MSLLVFIIVLSILVLVHEWGHFITARKCGVRVEQFALGFGPKLWSWVRGDTEYCLCLIPLGGYVKMAGDDRQHCQGKSDEYFCKSVGQRALIVLMGPVVNIVLGFICFWLVFMVGIVDMDESGKKVGTTIGQILAASPAEKGGLAEGDRIIAIDGQPVANWPQLQDTIRASQAAGLTVVLDRKGEQVTKVITPEEQVQKDIFGREHRIRRIGVGPVPIQEAKDMVILRYNPVEALGRAGKEVFDVSAKTYQALFEMLTGARSPKEVMGIIGMFKVINFALSIGISYVLHIVGIISVSLAVFNLLPLIPLDGGHLLLLGIEKLRGRALSLGVDQIITRVGLGLILALALFVFYVDFERIGLIDKIMHFIKPVG